MSKLRNIQLNCARCEYATALDEVDDTCVERIKAFMIELIDGTSKWTQEARDFAEVLKEKIEDL